jgi:hypothetical protein
MSDRETVLTTLWNFATPWGAAITLFDVIKGFVKDSKYTYSTDTAHEFKAALYETAEIEADPAPGDSVEWSASDSNDVLDDHERFMP